MTSRHLQRSKCGPMRAISAATWAAVGNWTAGSTSPVARLTCRPLSGATWCPLTWAPLLLPIAARSRCEVDLGPPGIDRLLTWLQATWQTTHGECVPWAGARLDRS